MQTNDIRDSICSNLPRLDTLNKSRISIDSVNNIILSQSMVSQIILNLRSSYHHAILFKLIILTGLKPQELVNIKAKHILEDYQSIYVPYSAEISNSNERFIGFESVFFKELRRFIVDLKPEDYVFSGRNGSMSWRSLSYTLKKVRKICGRDLTIKDFQNSFCISLLRNGANLSELAYFLGYKSNSAVKRRFRRMLLSEKSRYELIDSIFLKSA